MNLRDTAKSEAAKTGSVEEYEEYKTLRNIVSTKQKSAEGEYYKSTVIQKQAQVTYGGILISYWARQEAHFQVKFW